MSLFNPGPQPSISGRARRILSLLAHHHSALKEAFEWSDWTAAGLTVLLVVSWIKRWEYPEWLRSISEGVHITGAILIVAYVILRFLFHMARVLLSRKDPFADADEGQVNWRAPCSSDIQVVGSPTGNPEGYERDLEAAVKLCHESLGFEHDAFSIPARWKLYDGWCKANEKSIVLIKPQFGAAKGQPIGVTIVLPLRPEGLLHIQDPKGGVLKLDGRHIFPASRRIVPILLIDTLLLKDEWIPAYGPLAMKALFRHVSMFYNANSWLGTELYCSMFQGGAVGTYLPGMRKLIGARGFQKFGKTSEGETIFRLCLRSLAADPLTKHRYELYRSAMELCASTS